jgi:hypothetical protein
VKSPCALREHILLMDLPGRLIVATRTISASVRAEGEPLAAASPRFQNPRVTASSVIGHRTDPWILT